MHRFYVDGVSAADKSIIINGDDVNHIMNVLRLRVGDEVTIGDGSSRDYTCHIASMDENEVVCDIVDITDNAAELPIEITLYQGLPKGDKMELIIQKCVELGVSRIVPVEMDRCVVKLDDKKKQKKIERWQLIAESAAKQSRRGIIPQVANVTTYKKALEEAVTFDKVFVPYESAEGIRHTKEVFQEIAKLKTTGFFIGPEGGFADHEIEEAKAAGAEIVTLGSRILRTETAGLATMAMLSYEIETNN